MEKRGKEQAGWNEEQTGKDGDWYYQGLWSKSDGREKDYGRGGHAKWSNEGGDYERRSERDGYEKGLKRSREDSVEAELSRPRDGKPAKYAKGGGKGREDRGEEPELTRPRADRARNTELPSRPRPPPAPQNEAEDPIFCILRELFARSQGGEVQSGVLGSRVKVDPEASRILEAWGEKRKHPKKKGIMAYLNAKMKEYGTKHLKVDHGTNRVAMIDGFHGSSRTQAHASPERNS